MIRRRMGWRLATTLAGTAALTVAAAGCTTGSSGEEPQTITFVYGAVDDLDARSWEALAEAYEEAHPGVTIEQERLPGDSWAQVVQTRVQGGNAPDVFEVRSGGGQVGSLIPLAEAGLLLPLEDPQFAENQPADPSQWTLDETVYGVPTNIAVSGIVFNDEAAESIGIDFSAATDMQDLIDQCQDVRAAGKSMFVWAGSVPASQQILALTLATSSVYGPEPDWNEKRANGEVTFADSQGWKDALQTILDMYEAGCFQDGVAGAGFDAIVSQTTSANSLGLFTPSGAAKALMDNSGGAVTLVVHPTLAPAGYDTYVSVTTAFSVAGSASTESPELVEDFLKFLASPEGAGVFATTQGSIPAVGADTSNLLPQYLPVAEYIADVDRTRGWPPLGWPNAQVLEALGAGAQALVTGQMTVDEVLEQMDADWD